MKKNNLLKFGLIALLLVAFNLIVFLTTKKFTTTFWISYAFVMVSYAFLAFAFLIISNPKQKVFSGLSYFALTIIYHVLAILLGVIFMIAKDSGFIFPFIIQSLLVIIYMGLTIIGLMGNNIVTSSLERDQKNKHFLKTLAYKVSVIEQTVTDDALKQKLNRLFEIINSSPFHSQPGASEIEERLTDKVYELKDAADEHNYPLVERLTREAQTIVVERNNYLKLNH